MKKLGITASVLCITMAVIAVGAAFWQRSAHDSKESDANKHATVATVIQKAEAEGNQAGELLKQYVATGDASLIPQMQAQTSQGVTDLTSAVRQSGGDSNGFLDKGTQFVQASGKVIAMRQAGDVQGAAAALNQLGQQFQAFVAAQNQFAAQEQSLAESAHNSADSAQTAESWLFITAIALGIVGVSGGAVVAANSIRRRRSLQTGATV